MAPLCYRRHRFPPAIASPVAGINPITVDPAAQNRRIGRTLMQAVMDHATAQGKPSIPPCAGGLQ